MTARMVQFSPAERAAAHRVYAVAERRRERGPGAGALSLRAGKGKLTVIGEDGETADDEHEEADEHERAPGAAHGARVAHVHRAHGDEPDAHQQVDGVACVLRETGGRLKNIGKIGGAAGRRGGGRFEIGRRGGGAAAGRAHQNDLDLIIQGPHGCFGWSRRVVGCRVGECGCGKQLSGRFRCLSIFKYC